MSAPSAVAPVTEGHIMDAVRLALGREPGLCLWRNNIGVAEMRGAPGQRAHVVRFGVGSPGGADLIGLYRGRFLAIEIKTPTGRLSAEQRTFGQLVTRLGGVYAVVRGEAEAVELLGWLRGAGERPEFVFRSQPTTEI